MNEALFISVKPEFVAKIFDGSKTIELRKSAPRVNKGELVIIYSTSPVMSIIGTCIVQDIIVMKPSKLWNEYSSQLGIDKKRFSEYYQDKDLAIGIVLKEKKKFNKPIPLNNFRKTFPKFQPPQTFRYIDKKQFEKIL